MKQNTLITILVTVIIILAGVIVALMTNTLPLDDTTPTNTSAQQAAQTDAEEEPQMGVRVEADQVYATVNGEEITGRDVLQLAQQVPQQAFQNPQLVEILVNQLVNDTLIDSLAQDSAVTTQENVQQAIDQAKARIVREAYVREAVSDEISEEDLRKKYEELVFDMPQQTQARASHILVEDEDLAEDLIEQLEDGADFAELAQEHSTGPSAGNGGDIGYFTKDQVLGAFAEHAFALEPGEVSEEPVQTQFGWHVVKLVDKRPTPKPEFENVKDQLRAQLGDQVLRDKIKALRDNADIELNIPEPRPLKDIQAEQQQQQQADQETEAAENSEETDS